MPEPSLADGASKPKDSPKSPLPVGLIIVATPIGNASDLSMRALDILNRADLIACEDTRTTAKLLSYYGIKARTIPYHEHNADKMRPKLMERFHQGQTVALVSDAGTPLVSDPGYKLVRACLEEGVPVTHAPGPSSVMTALVLSGLPSDRFLFIGFLPHKSGARRTTLSEVTSVRASIIVLESARRLIASLADMVAVFGARPAAVTRELTKMFEEVRRGTLVELAAHYAEAGPPKGEVTIVIGPPDAEQDRADDARVDALLDDALKTLSVRDAAQAVAEQTGRSKRDVYNLALARPKP